MMDSKAFRTLSYGMYVIGVKGEDERAGCIANTFVQVTSAPAQASITLNKDNHTCRVLQETGRFTVSVLDRTAPMELIGTFGFHTSTELDKFAHVSFATDSQGVPYVTEHTCARFSVKVVGTVDVGTHITFIGEIDQAESLSSEDSMTYVYYHQVKGGKTPPKASNFNPQEAAEGAVEAGAGGKVAWRCMVCGHIEYADELPDTFTCPICGAGKEMFERIEV